MYIFVIGIKLCGAYYILVSNVIHICNEMFSEKCLTNSSTNLSDVYVFVDLVIYRGIVMNDLYIMPCNVYRTATHLPSEHHIV